MSRRGWPAVVAVMCGVIFVTTGCSRSPKVTFYTLAATAPRESAVSPGTPYSVQVGPATLPEVVDRPQLVLRVGPNRVNIIESHRWAEPLKSQVPLLIAQNLSRLLRSDRIFAYPAGRSAEYTVMIDFVQFEAVQEEAVTVDALWSIRSAAAAARSGRSSVKEAIAGSGYDAVAAAYSRALTVVSGDIAKGIAGR